MTPAQKTVLVVDDDPDIVEVLRTMLEEEGYRVLTTGNSQEIERLIATTPPDLILLDLLLSGTDGRTITQQLKSQDQSRHIPVLLLSAHPGAEAEAYAAGADGYIAKPFDIEEFLATITSYMAMEKEIST